MTDARKRKVLFLCTGNACRSQMAEAFARELTCCDVEPYSAGIVAAGILPETIEVMQEIGYDLSGHYSKQLHELADIDFDTVVTLCDYAHQTCPIFPGKTRVIHRGFDDPPSLARTAKTPEEALGHYRRVRDEIKAFIETLPEALEKKN